MGRTLVSFALPNKSGISFPQDTTYTERLSPRQPRSDFNDSGYNLGSMGEENCVWQFTSIWISPRVPDFSFWTLFVAPSRKSSSLFTFLPENLFDLLSYLSLLQLITQQRTSFQGLSL